MQKTCSNCAKEFHCGATSSATNGSESFSCWCEELPRVSMIGTTEQDCLCPDCLKQAIAKPGEKTGERLPDLV